MAMVVAVELTPLAKWLRRYLYALCQGEAKARKRAEILFAANSEWFAITHVASAGRFSDEELRLAKEELIETYKRDRTVGMLVCSGPRGWWAAASTKDTDAAADFLEQRAFDLLGKADTLRRGGYDEFGPQTVML